MKRLLVIASALCLAWSAQAEESWAPWLVAPRNVVEKTDAGCPSFPGVLYASLTYNKGCVPWELEFSSETMSGDVTGAYFQWYRYKDGQAQSTATACDWQTDHTTFAGFKPATDENNSRYIYFCKVTTPSCPGGVKSGTFTVVVGSATDPCPTFAGTTFTITSGGSYRSGQTVTITARTNAYGGDHIYTWYHNGEPLDENDPRYTFEWGFNEPKLIITNIKPEDGGTYSVMMQDGSECFMYTDPVRILVDNPSCGPNPTLSISKTAVCEGESAMTGVSNNTLAAGEEGKIVYMVQPEGSHPSTTVGNWTTDKPGLYQFKYQVSNPDNPSCFRESKVVSITVYGAGAPPTIKADVDLIKINGTIHFTTTGLQDGETGTITYSKDGGPGGQSIWPADAHTVYQSGTYTYTYTITNPKVPTCTRTATTTVVVYSCGWVTARFNNWVAGTVDLGASINLGPAIPTEPGMKGTLYVSYNGGPEQEISVSSPYIPTADGEYKFRYVVEHSDPRVTDCSSEVSKTITVRPCATQATVTPDKSVLKLGESVTLSLAAKKSAETSTLTYSKNGGATVNIQNNPSASFNWTPTETGTYVITYTIKGSGTCSTTDRTTVTVYDCGPDAAITATPDPVLPGKPVTLTLSAPGADETATLTVQSPDGSNAQILNDQIVNGQMVNAFIPTEEGTYIFTYTVTHAYINCTRSAQATVQVLECDPEVTVNTDKDVLALGESVNILLSRTANSRETATLTVQSPDGSNDQMVNGQIVNAFTPTEKGTYTLTYTLQDPVLGCTTTDNTTFTVYNCGPDASVVASRNTTRTDDPVTITVSAPGENETATLTVSRNGGTPSPVALTSSPITFTPTEEGTYTFTYTVTHAYINCTRTAEETVGVSDCGEAVTLKADKTIVTLGEAVNLTTSREPDANETPSFTITRNGQILSTPMPNAQMVNGKMVNVFTPAATGDYRVAYSLQNTLLNCETSSEVFFSVYECGPEAAIEADKSALRLGEAVNLTLSALGAEETATLTVQSPDGSNAQILNDQIVNGQMVNAFTPTEEGTYTLTYTVTHPYINCTRTASATFTVYDCGVPASVTTDKTDLRLGESVTLSLSAVSDVETATLTVQSPDGSNAQILNDQIVNGQMVNAFTPTEEGTYTFTYTVSHTKIDCETTSQKTIHVYDCGPDADIRLSAGESKLQRPVTITLSAPGADETATLTVQSPDGSNAQMVNDQIVNVYTPSSLGEYTFTYTVTHPYINCTRTVTATLNVVEAELVFDDKNGSKRWSDPLNWWPAYNRLPNVSDSAVIRKPCVVDIPDAVTYDLTFDDASAEVVIDPKGALVIARQVLNSTPASFTVTSDATGSGALVLGADNTSLPATVQFYSCATDMNGLFPVWQYMGTPVQEELSISATYPQAMFYGWSNTPNKKTGGNWLRVDSLAGSLSPFTGYCMTHTAPKTYTIKGTLNDPRTRTVAIPYNDRGTYPGFAFVANSWVAPIDIASLETTDFGDADATVYIMNAGSYQDALQQQLNASRQGTASARGQYNTIPVHAASYLPNALTVIPPMQGFFVHTGKATTLTLDYHKSVYTPALAGVKTTPLRAPALSPQDGLSALSVSGLMSVKVSGFGAEDEVCLLVGEDFTTAFENGWDGRKARSEKSDISLAVAAPDGDLAVAALPELEGTEIVFNGSNHKTYTLEVSSLTRNPSPLTSPLYLLDRETGVYTLLEEGASYSFKCGAAPRRFVIVRQIGGTEEQAGTEEIEAVKFIEDGLFYIRYGNRLYNGNGRLLETR